MSDIRSFIWKVTGMAAWDAIVAEHRAARSAPIPDLSEIRRLSLLESKAREKWIKSWASNWDDFQALLSCERHCKTTFMVYDNDDPRKSPPRGPGSPVKTGEIRQFEAMVKRVFPGARQATTEWRGND